MEISKSVHGTLWPELPWDAWNETSETLRRWMQVVGKVQLALTPFLNEWWGVGFQVSARGISSGLIPCTGEDGRVFEVHFDFLEHQLNILVSDGQSKSMRLAPFTVADFHSRFLELIHALGISVRIDSNPVELSPVIPFEQDTLHSSYDAESVQRWWRILVQTTRVLQRFRSTFVGKSSPILFYWGSFDLNTTRFSGRSAPLPKAGPHFYKIAEDQENLCCGFWPGNVNAMGYTFGAPAFYAYVYPAPDGIENAVVRPRKAYFNKKLGEFILPYDDLRRSSSPEQDLLEFFQSAYEAGANLAHWDREALDQSLSSLTRKVKSEEERLKGVS